jgi:hypothetical protein
LEVRELKDTNQSSLESPGRTTGFLIVLSLRKKYEEVVIAIACSPYIQGYCYTQLYDIEGELNGFALNPFCVGGCRVYFYGLYDGWGCCLTFYLYLCLRSLLLGF